MGGKDIVETNSCKVISLEQFRWRKAGQLLRLKLGEFAASARFADQMAKAQQLYLADLDPELINDNDDIILERCFEWFIFDYDVEDGLTLIDIYRATKTTTPMEKKLLKEWSGSRLSVFKVCGFALGKGLVIEDLLRDRQVTIDNYSISGQMEPGSVIFMRILSIGDQYEFSTGGPALPAAYAKPLIKKIRSDISRCIAGKSKGSFSLEDYLKKRAHKINAWVMDQALQSFQTDNDTEPVVNPKNPGTPSMIAQRITDVFLDDYYEKWINQPIQALEGKTPRELCKTVRGRAKVEEILEKLERVERRRFKKGEPYYDINKVRARLGLIPGEHKAGPEKNRDPAQKSDWQGYPWKNHRHARVALQIRESMKAEKYSDSQVEGALKLWYDYCAKEDPTIRKEQLWVAVVIYTLGRLEFDSNLQQQKLAEKYGISASSLSTNYRSMCRSLDLVIFDRRYTTGKSPIEELELTDPLLAKILYKLKL